MKNNQPLVSICIPTLNGAAYLEECLHSAINQTYAPLEIIISDDASTDQTLQIVEAFRSQTKIPIHVFNHEPNGIGANWNNCILHANGEFIKFLFQDDILVKDCIEQMVGLITQDQNTGLVYAKRHFITDTESESVKAFKDFYGLLHRHWNQLEPKNGLIEGQDYLKDKHFLNAPKNKIGEPTSVLLRASVFKDVGYFKEDLKQVLDCEFWYRLMPYYKIGFVDAYLSSFRLHASQASVVNKSAKINETERLYQIYYHTLMPYLHKQCRQKLKKRFHPILSKLAKLKSKLR